jgi:hypothetical protein
MYFLWWIPAIGWIIGLIYSIIVAVGGPSYKRSYVNFARGLLIWKGIMLVLAILFFVLFWSTVMTALIELLKRALQRLLRQLLGSINKKQAKVFGHYLIA